MQKPFKFTPAFDRMLAAVHARDPNPSTNPNPNPTPSPKQVHARDPEGVILLHEIQARYA
eukprot:scaffold68117_cov48-Phaeocystis_antarctica.AAC.2